MIQAPLDILGIAGSAGKAVEARATLYPLVQFVSMAQPLILMTIYMFLPLIVVIGRYSLQVMFLGGLAIFTIKMWPLMWFIARVMDDHLLKAMYPDAATVFGQFLRRLAIRVVSTASSSASHSIPFWLACTSVSHWSGPA